MHMRLNFNFKLYQRKEEERQHKQKKPQVLFSEEYNTMNYLQFQLAAAPQYSLPGGSSTRHICSVLRNPNM